MSVPLSSADLSQSDAGGALGDWEQEEATTPLIPPTHPPDSTTAEVAASESPPPIEPQSDSELLSAFVQRRDADAFTEIVQRYRLLVYRVAFRAVDDRHLADDVFQATFLVLAQSAHKIKHTEALAAWLHGTTRNIARRALGNQYAEQKQLTDWAKQTLAQKGEEMATSTEADPFEELARRNEQQLLDEELQQLPEASRAPLVLFYLERKTQAEIAQIMGLSVEAVEGRLKRAKQELRTRLIRRGVLLSTVVAAATVLTPSITSAAPAASLVSATVTTALGTAALGSTALGATAVTGAATSSKLAAGSATASTLAAQEVAIMSVTSKATAMLITTAASTTLISGLVLGAMVGTFSMGAGGSAQTGSQPINSPADLRGVINESSDPGLISPENEDQVQFALVEPEQQKEGAEQPAVKSEVVKEEVKAVAYSVADLSEDELVKAAECVVSLAADISVHETTQSLVIRATQENHKQIAKQLSALRSQHSPWMSDQFRLVLARGRLATLMKEFGENHPKVKAGQSAIATLEKSIAEGTKNPQVFDEQVQVLGHPEEAHGADVNVGIGATAAPTVIAPAVSDVVEIKELETTIQLPPPFIAKLRFPEHITTVDAFNGKYMSVRAISPKELGIELLTARQDQMLVTGKSGKEYKIEVKRMGHEEQSHRTEVTGGQASPQGQVLSPAADSNEDVKQGTPKVGAEPETSENITVTYSVADCISPQLISELAKNVKRFAESVSYHESTRSLVVNATRRYHRKVPVLIHYSREEQSYAWDPQFELIWLKKRLSEKQRELGDDAAEVKSLRAQVESVEKKIAAQPPEEKAQRLVEMSRRIEQQQLDVERLRQQLDELKASGVCPSKGLIAQVDPSKRTVWLHMGRRSNLLEKTTFSVADKSLAGVIRGTQDLKGKIEVVEAYYEGAVARIVEQDPKRPIQAGDSIFSPIWSERGTTEFALIGNGDLNGDFLKDDNDRQLLRTVVGNAKGEITLEVNDEGARVPADAKITAQTKWLVVGDLGDPLNGANDPATKARLLAIHNQHADLVQEAREYGVKIVSLNDFLAYMGWKPERQLNLSLHMTMHLMTLKIGEERMLIGSNFKLGDLASVVSDRPDIVQVVDQSTLRAIQDGVANITLTDVDGKTAHVEVNVPRQYIRSVSLLRNLTPVEKTIYEVLRRQEQLEFPQQTLDQFAGSLSAKYQIPVKVDWPALETAGVAKRATVSFSGLKRVEHALTDILSDVGGQRLEFYVDNGELHFTTQEAMRTTNRIREYDLSSLGEGHLNYDLPFPGDGELDFALQYADSLSQEITRQGKVLSFNAPLSNHKKFERFLAMLPELLKEPLSTHAPPVPKKSIEGDTPSVSDSANQAK